MERDRATEGVSEDLRVGIGRAWAHLMLKVVALALVVAATTLPPLAVLVLFLLACCAPHWPALSKLPQPPSLLIVLAKTGRNFERLLMAAFALPFSLPSGDDTQLRVLRHIKLADLLCTVALTIAAMNAPSLNEGTTTGMISTVARAGGDA